MSNVTIYLDAGHGESITGRADPGAVGPTGLRENDVALDMVQRVAHLLRSQGHTVLGATIGATDDRENLREAYQAANAAHVDLFVSLHCNASPVRDAHGVEVWHGASAASMMAARAVLNHIAWDFANGGQWLKMPHPLTNRGIKRGNFAVLTRTHMPAILIELAFISNPGEEALLRDKYAREQFAQAIADGITEWARGR